MSKSNFSRLCKLALILATNGVEVQTVRSGVVYVVGRFSAQMCAHLLEKCMFLGCSRPSELLFLLKHLALS